jgi:hypothetical protein
MSKTIIIPGSEKVERVEEALPAVITGSTPAERTGIPHEYKGKGGRPSKEHPTLRLPRGYQTLRVMGKVVYNDQVGSDFLEAYYECGGSLTRACRQVGVRFRAALQWRDEIPEFAMGLREIDEILKDEVHSQFMARVLEEEESNPSWKFKYFNKHFPEYSETKKSVKVSLNLKDTLIKPTVIEAQVIRDEPRPE